MTKRHAPADPDRIVLRCLATRRYIFGVPRRDLTAADLERLVYRNANRIRPGDAGFDEALAKRTASLARSGLYELVGAPGDTVTVDPEPADPAPETAIPPAAPQSAAPAAEE